MSVSPRRGSVDWAGVRARLAAIAEPRLVDPESLARTLRERAIRLAVPLTSRRDASETALRVLCFQRGARRYAVESRFVVEVLGARKLSRVPGAQSALIGLANLRGDMVPVFDLSHFDPDRSQAPIAPQLVVLGTNSRDFALLVDSADDVNEVLASELARPASLGNLSNARFIRGVAADARLLLDGEAMLADRTTLVARPKSSEHSERD